MMMTRMFGWTAAGVLAISGASTTQGAVVFQADFNGPGTGTGGAADIVALGGTGELFDTARTSIETADPMSVASAGYFHADTGGIGRAHFNPTSAASSLDAMTSVVSGDRVMNGGFDFFFRTAAEFNNHSQFRPIDVDNRGNGGFRLIMTSVLDAGATPDRIAIEILSNPNGLFAGSDAGANSGNINFSGNTKILADTVYHVGLSFESDVAGTITTKLWFQEGIGAIDLSGTPLGSISFGVNEAVSTAGFAAGAFDLKNSAGATAQDFDTFRIYDSTPTEFAGLPVPEPASLVLMSLGALMFIRRR